MRKLSLLCALVLAAGLANADQVKPTVPAAKPSPKVAATKAVATTHEVQAEIVSFDAAKNVVTIKGTPENKTFPVDAQAVAAVAALKPGEKTTLLCRDNSKGEHQAVAGVKATTAAKAAPAPTSPKK